MIRWKKWIPHRPGMGNELHIQLSRRLLRIHESDLPKSRESPAGFRVDERMVWEHAQMEGVQADVSFRGYRDS